MQKYISAYLCKSSLRRNLSIGYLLAGSISAFASSHHSEFQVYNGIYELFGSTIPKALQKVEGVEKTDGATATACS